MKHYLKLDSSGVVWGYSAADEAPGQGWVEVGFSAEGVISRPTKFRLVGDELVDTGQPSFPPAPYMVWSEQQIAWVDARDLAGKKDAKWEEIKAAREAAEFGGFTWDGSTFDSDPLSQQRIAGAVQLASLDPTGFTIDWTLADNTFRTLNAQEMTAVGVAMGQHVNAQHVKARILRQQIEAATTEAELDAIVWQ